MCSVTGNTYLCSSSFPQVCMDGDKPVKGISPSLPLSASCTNVKKLIYMYYLFNFRHKSHNYYKNKSSPSMGSPSSCWGWLHICGFYIADNWMGSLLQIPSSHDIIWYSLKLIFFPLYLSPYMDNMVRVSDYWNMQCSRTMNSVLVM